jgi:hypothetical protein
MSIKLCFKDEIHKCPKLPANYEALLAAIDTVFKDQLDKTKIDLYYQDSDGDSVMLTSEDDYVTMLEGNANNQNKACKVYITLKGEKPVNTSMMSNSSIILNKKEGDEFQIIDTKPKNDIEEILKEEPKPETIQMEKLPVVQQKVDEIKDAHDEPEILRKEGEEKIAEPVPLVDQLDEEFLKKHARIMHKVPHRPEPEAVVIPESNSPHVEAPKLAVHEFVKCDGCGMIPIVGNRYQCSQCYNFDFCEFCEASKEHAHPFLKIKKPVVHVQKESGFTCVKNKFQEIKGKTVETLKKAYSKVDQTVSNLFSTEESKEVPKKAAPRQDIQKEVIPLYQVTLLKEIESVPKVLYTETKVFFKTMLIKNTGILNFPDGCYLVNMEEENAQKMLIPALEVEKDASCVIKILSPQKPGKYTCKCKLAFVNESGKEQTLGKPFEIHYEVVEKFPNEVIAKAHKLQELFPLPGKDMEFYCQTVKESGNATIEELIENFLQQKH